jgi:hypothetical protein
MQQFKMDGRELGNDKIEMNKGKSTKHWRRTQMKPKSEK